MITYYHANALEQLASEFVATLTKKQPTNPFKRPWIVVQNKETEQWLTLFIARKLGIAANFEFILPSQLIWNLYRQVHPELPKSLPSDRIPLQWQIFELLQKKAAQYEKAGLVLPKKQDLQLFLSDQIADVFDLYQQFRPALLLNWEQRKLVTKNPAERWQQMIWRDLTDEWKVKFPDVPHRGSVLTELSNVLRNTDQTEVAWGEDIYLFGLSHWSSVFVNILQSISLRSSVHFFTQHVKADYSYPFKPISGWISPKIEAQEILLNDANANDNLTFETLSEQPVPNPQIEIHACHNERREVEVLKYRLLSAFEQSAELRPEDILIMVPDVQIYGPIIKSVFSEKSDEPAIPTFLYQTASSSPSILIEQLTKFTIGSAKVSEFFEILEHPSILKNFEIQIEELDWLKSEFSSLNIHYGLLKSHSDYSIEKGLLSIYSGFALQPIPFHKFEDHIPSESAHGFDALRSVSKFSRVFDLLQQIHTEQTSEHTISVWLKRFKTWFLALLPSDDARFLSSFDRLMEMVELVDSDRVISFTDAGIWLSEQLSEQSASSSGLGRGLVISSYIPYRNVPFKWTAILGISEEAFPRKNERPEFDLIVHNPMPGDRDTQKEDKLLFAERILNTSEQIYLSYLGYSGSNKQYPSILVQELLDAHPKLEVEEEKLHRFHPLYAVEKTNFSQEVSDLFTEVYAQKKAYLSSFETFRWEEEWDEIDLQELILFYTHPTKLLLKHKLGIGSLYEDNTVSDREHFKLEGLRKYVLKTEIMNAHRQGVGFHQAADFLQTKGLLPASPLTISMLSDEWNPVSNLYAEVEPFFEQLAEQRHIEFEIGGSKISGSIPDMYLGTHINWRIGSIKANQMITVWIYYLALLINKTPNLKITMLGIDTKRVQKQSYRSIEDPAAIMESLITHFKSTISNPENWCLISDMSMAYIEELRKSKNEEKALNKAAISWFGSDFGGTPGHIQDFYNHLVWTNRMPYESRGFQAGAELVWNPLLDALLEDEL
jgi:exonuclease V gamma subunit